MSKNERNCKKDKENVIPGKCLVFYRWSIEYYRWILSFNICSGCAVFLYPCTWLSLPSPYQRPLKPSFPVGSRQNWMKDMARSLLGPGLRLGKALGPGLDTSPSISKSRCFFFFSKEHDCCTWVKGMVGVKFQLLQQLHHKQWNNGTPPLCYRSVGWFEPWGRTVHKSWQRNDCVCWERAH